MTLILNNPSKPHLKRWTKKEYHAQVDRGAFRGQHIFLYRGELTETPPMGFPHGVGVALVNRWAVRAFDFVRCQSPFETPGESIPEPDIAVLTEEQFHRKPQPCAAMLIVEVSDSSLELDRAKAHDYAAAGVPDYWILDLVNRQLIVHRNPIADASAPLGFNYSSVHLYPPSGAIAPLAKASAAVSVTEFLAGI